MPPVNNKKPLGVYIFSGLNICLFGAVSLAAALIFVTVPAVAEKFIVAAAQTEAASLSPVQIKALGWAQILISATYIFCGLGLLRGKEKARRINIYFSFALLLLVLISVLAQPSMIGQSLFNAAYPLAMIIYFTDRKVEKWFKENESS